MREIKFRAWDNAKEKMYFIGEESDIVFTFDSEGIIATDISESEEAFKALHHLQYMQYTGLKDKNGKEIYEGDIVSARLASNTAGFTGYVHYLNAQYWVNYIGYESYYQALIYLHGAEYEPIEVIGNIYGNPELLKESEGK